MGFNSDFRLYIIEKDQFDRELKDRHLEPPCSITFTDGADALVEQFFATDNAPTRHPMPVGTTLWCYVMGGELEQIEEDDDGPLIYILGKDLRGLSIPSNIEDTIDASYIRMLKVLPDDAVIIPVWV